MRRLAAWSVFLAAALWLLLCHYRYVEHYRCDECLARRTDTQWRLGFMPLGHPIFHDFGSVHGPGALALMRQVGPVEPSLATTQLFPRNHTHTWALVQASPYYLFGTKWAGCVLGAGYRYTPFAYAYLGDPGFREHVAHLLESGRYSRESLVQLFTAGPKYISPELFSQGVAMALEYWRAHPNPYQETLFHKAYDGGA
jgi:hypothetical protein